MTVIGICKAIYEYASQQPNHDEPDTEISIAEGETLYILERGDDGWWKVRKKAEGDEEEGEEGLVPANYVEEATPISNATAMYDYDRQTSEEITLTDGAKVAIYDKEDPDWFLVECNGSFGFAPSNYLEAGTSHSPAAVAHEVTRPESVISLPPAITRPDFTDHTAREVSEPEPEREEEQEEEAPPTPKRPTMAPRPPEPSPPPAAQPTRYQTWAVQEVDGKKKKKGTLGIGNMEISWAPDKSSESIQTWSITSLINYSTEKKHVFIDLQSPPRAASFDFHAGSSNTAAEINQVLGDMAGAARAPGIREIAGALKAPLPAIPANSGLAKKEENSGFPKQDDDDADYATVLYDFEAQGEDEVTVRAGAKVIILDDRASPDWWKIRVGRKEGVIPADYLETSAPKRSKRKSAEPKQQEPKQELKPQHTGKSKPDPKKVRSWTDRSRSFRVDAQLLGCSDGKIHLHKSNGVKISVPISKMCSEDIEYVEHKIGRSLTQDTERKTEKEERKVQSKPKAEPSVVQAKPKASSNFDWFDFFLAVGCDPNVCQRYTAAFERDGLGEEDITSFEPSMLRTLGVKEGDILRIGRAVDARLGRQREAPASFGDVLQRDDKSGSGLLSGPGGELKNNTRRGRPERTGPPNDFVDAAALKTKTQSYMEDLSLLDSPLIPVKAEQPVPPQVTQASQMQAPQIQAQQTQAPRTQSAPIPEPIHPSQQPTFSQQFFQSLQAPTAPSAPAVAPFMPQTSFGTAIVAHKTGGGDIKSFVQPPLYTQQTGHQQMAMQPAPYQDPFKTGSAAPYQDPFKTGPAMFQPMQTGFQPMQTGFQPVQNGFPPSQTGFQPMQTGFQPMQTGFQPMQPAPMQTGFQPMQTGFQQNGFQNVFQPHPTGFSPMQPQPQLFQPGPLPGYQQPFDPAQPFTQPSQGYQMSAGMLKMQEMMAQAQAQQPQFQPVSFGRPASTGPRKPNLNAATATNPFGL